MMWRWARGKKNADGDSSPPSALKTLNCQPSNYLPSALSFSALATASSIVPTYMKAASGR